MYYNLDLISLMIFAASCVLLIKERRNIRQFRLSVYGMTLLVAVYLVVGLILCARWHAETGKLLLVSFPAMDYLYFSLIVCLMPGFMMLFFMEFCYGKVQKFWRIFIAPVALLVAMLLFNPKYGFMFYYVGDVYHRGPLLWINYLMWIVYILICVLVIIRHRLRIGRSAVLAFLLFFFYQIGLQVYQFQAMEFYVGGIAGSTGLVFLIIMPLLLDSAVDDLTGFYNRNGFMRNAKDLIARSKVEPCAIIAINIFNFRNINERFSFEIGNRVILYVAKLIKERFPENQDGCQCDVRPRALCARSDQGGLSQKCRLL